MEVVSFSKRSSWAAGGGGSGWVDDPVGGGGSGSSYQLDSFPPVTLTVSSFFKQVCKGLEGRDPSALLCKCSFAGERQAEGRGPVQVPAGSEATLHSAEETQVH